MSSTWMACRRQLFPFPPSGSSVFPAAGLQPELIFLLVGQSAADMALRLVDVQHHPGLGRQGGIDVGEAVGDVFMYCRYKLDIFSSFPQPATAVLKYGGQLLAAIKISDGHHAPSPIFLIKTSTLPELSTSIFCINCFNMVLVIVSALRIFRISPNKSSIYFRISSSE